MENEFGYIDDKPFEDCDEEEQTLSIISTDKQGIQFKIYGFEKYSVFNDEKAPNVLYGVNQKLEPITAFRVRIMNSKLSAISSSVVKSDFYFYGSSDEKIHHFTEKSLIYELDYYNDSIYKVFGNKSMTILYGKETTSIAIDRKIKEEKIGEVDIENNHIDVILKYEFNQFFDNNSSNKAGIIPDNCIALVFKNGLDYQEAYKYVLLLDSVFYMMTLLERRHKKLVVHLAEDRNYLWRDRKIEDPDKIVKTNSFLLSYIKDRHSTFLKIFETLYDLEKKTKNVLFPFWEFDRAESSVEISFLEYYRAMEYLIGKGDRKFLLNVLRKYPELKKRFFCDQDIVEIEEEVRSLRNYYSHEGYFIDKLPIPTYTPKRYRDVTVKWLFDVYHFMVIASYLEIYQLFDIYPKWYDLLNIVI